MRDHDMNENFMKTKPVLPLLLSMSLPMMLSMLVNSLYNIIDSFFVAKISEDAMTALSLVFPVQNFINAVSIGFGIGINAVIAICMGANEVKKAHTAATIGLFLAICHAIVLTVGSIFLMPSFLKMFTTSQSVLSLGIQYSNIAFCFTIVSMTGISFEKIFQSVGKMTVTMISMCCGCITNIILDPLLIFGIGFLPRLGIAGAALATGIGQIVTLSIYLVVYFSRPLPVHICRCYLKPHGATDKKLYAIGVPAILNLALPSLLVSFLNALLAGFSQSYVVVLGIYYKLQTFLYLPANGIIQGMRPIIGYNYGAREMKRVKKIYDTTLAMTAAMMLAGTLGCLFAAKPLIALFTANPETIELGTRALHIICLGFIVSAVSVTASGALEGLGKGFSSFIISLLRYVAVIIPAAFILCHTAGPAFVWHAFWITEALTAVVAAFVYRQASK